ncbi:MAG: formate dehydrogenase accessory sulfurtransferase FdhD [Desulfobacterales bacterium]
MNDDELGASTHFKILRIENGRKRELTQAVATEVPCTIRVNGTEAATLLVTPTQLKVFTLGYLFTAGMINTADEVHDYYCDSVRWRVDVRTANNVDLKLLGKRLYTSGCGKGVLYASVIKLSARHPLKVEQSFSVDDLTRALTWLLTHSQLYKDTRGVHSVALSPKGAIPELTMDDIGRHNATDKIIGHGLLHHLDFKESALLCTGRISSEILHKVKRAEIPLVMSRSVPTHQTILLAREMGVTVVGAAGSGRCSVYTHPDRVTLD